MIDIFAIPYQYIKDVGLGESAMLLYLMKMVSSSKTIVGQHLINKKQMREDDCINFIQDSMFDSFIEKLYDFGFVHFYRKSGRKTRTISVSVVNIIMYELLGKEQYLLNLTEYETKRLCGKVIPFSLIDSLNFDFPEYKSMTSKNFYVSYDSSIDEVVKQVKNVYLFDIQKIDKFIDDGGNFIPKEDGGKTAPVNQCSFFMLGHNSLIFNGPLYHNLLYGGKITINANIEQEDIQDDDCEPTLKELARNNYNKFCEYMCIGQTMKKPILEWNSKDFVSYIYCGLAKLRENEGDFVFPDFSKDCTRMKKLMDKYGNKRLNKVIYMMVKNTEDMAEYCRFVNFKPTPSILSVDWMFDKMLDYVSHVESENAQASLSQILQNNVVKNDNVKPVEQVIDLKNEDNCVKLKELRETFNKDKETK